jgi:hypothetical protein
MMTRVNLEMPWDDDTCPLWNVMIWWYVAKYETISWWHMVLLDERKGDGWHVDKWKYPLQISPYDATSLLKMKCIDDMLRNLNSIVAMANLTNHQIGC